MLLLPLNQFDVLAILHKEITLFFSSLVAGITLGVFLLTTSLFLWIFPDSSILDSGYASLSSLFAIVPYTFMFLIPAITMRALAEEKKEGTFELLTTKPITDWQLILGKYLACLTIVLFALVPTLVYYFSVFQLGVSKGNIDTGGTIGSYIGLFLLGGSFTAIGIFTSSLSKNQLISFVIAVFLCFFAFAGLDAVGQIFSLQGLANILNELSVNTHYQSISRGVLDSRDLLYFLSFITSFLVITKTIIGSRKW